MATILNASLGETTLLQNELRMGAMGGGPAYGPGSSESGAEGAGDISIVQSWSICACP